jgi:hypothetical protein
MLQLGIIGMFVAPFIFQDNGRMWLAALVITGAAIFAAGVGTDVGLDQSICAILKRNKSLVGQLIRGKVPRANAGVPPKTNNRRKRSRQPT